MSDTFIFYCVMVNDAMYPGSLSFDKVGASSYLGDAKHVAAKGAKVYLARCEITKVKGYTEKETRKRLGLDYA